MPPKPKRSWFDIQMTIMTVSMASALGLWNLFAGPDRAAAFRKAAEAQASPEPVELSPTPEAPMLNANAFHSKPGEKTGHRPADPGHRPGQAQGRWRRRWRRWRRRGRRRPGNFDEFILMLHRHPFRAMGCQMLAILERMRVAPAILNQVPDWFEAWEQSPAASGLTANSRA
jgi:hypothetical protein